MSDACLTIIPDMKSDSPEWYRKSFRDDYLWLYAYRDEEHAEREVEVAVEHLPFEKGQLILDVACGAGRHMLAFARAGAAVTGIDLSDVLLTRAHRRFSSAGFTADLVRADMRRLPFQACFNGATMWFTSFGYFPTVSEDLIVLTEIASALKPDGWWWIDIPNPANLMENLIPLSTRELEGPNGPAVVVEKRRIHDNHVIKEIEIEDSHGNRSYEERVRLYTPERFGNLVRKAGLTKIGILGDYDGSPFTPDVPRQIWYGVKETNRGEQL
jgi:SAM-dependent methyltransferase